MSEASRAYEEWRALEEQEDERREAEQFEAAARPFIAPKTNA